MAGPGRFASCLWLAPPASASQRPAKARAQRQQLQHGDRMKLAGEGLLACLVAKQRAAGIGAAGPAEQRQHKQRRLLHPPPSRLGLELVDAESGKGEEVHGDQCDGEIGEREQLRDGVGHGAGDRLRVWGFGKWPRPPPKPSGRRRLARLDLVAATGQKSGDGNVFVEFVPVEADSAHLHFCARFGGAMQQPGKPGEGNAERAAIFEIDPKTVLIEADGKRLGRGGLGVRRNSHSRCFR